LSNRRIATLQTPAALSTVSKRGLARRREEKARDRLLSSELGRRLLESSGGDVDHATRVLDELERRRGAPEPADVIRLPRLHPDDWLDDAGVSEVDLARVRLDSPIAWLVAIGFEATSAPLVGSISDRRGRLWPLRLGALGAAVCFIVLPALDSHWWTFAAAIVVCSFALGAFWAPSMSLIPLVQRALIRGQPTRNRKIRIGSAMAAMIKIVPWMSGRSCRSMENIRSRPRPG